MGVSAGVPDVYVCVCVWRKDYKVGIYLCLTLSPHSSSSTALPIGKTRDTHSEKDKLVDRHTEGH